MLFSNVTPEQYTCGWGEKKKFEQVGACRCHQSSYCLQISRFSRSTIHVWRADPGTRRKEQLQDFPCMDLFVAGLPQIDFPN